VYNYTLPLQHIDRSCHGGHLIILLLRYIWFILMNCLIYFYSSYVYRGEVVLAFEKNGSSKVGVLFDDPIDAGNDLGGLCDRNRGLFCYG